MLLLITVPKSLQVRLHSDNTAASAKAHGYLRDRMHMLIGHAVEHKQDASTLAAAIMSSIGDADRVALAAMGFTGVALVLVFEAEQVAEPATRCCTVGCDSPAEWRVVDPTMSSDLAESHTCLEHLPKACKGIPDAVVTKLG